MHGMRWLTVPLLILTLLAGSTLAQPLLEVQVSDKLDLKLLAGNGFDIIDGPRGFDDGVQYVVGWDGAEETLQHIGLAYSVYIEDMVAYNQANLGDEVDDMGGYPTYSEYGEWIETFAAAHPDIVSGPHVAGWTLEGREIWYYKMSDNPGVDEDEPEIFINGLIHAREVVTALSIQHVSEWMADQYGSDPRITAAIDDREIFFMPIMNPDGYVENEITNPNGGGMHRKNMRAPDGVDLNRNWDFMWGLDDQGSSPDPYDATYRGESPGSEPETIVAKDFINSREFESILNLHTYSELILLPWGYTYTRPPDWDIYWAFGNYLNETLDWEVGGPEVIYLTNGDAHDWQAAGDPDEPTSADYRSWAVTFEIGSWWEGGFWPSFNDGMDQAVSMEEPFLRFIEMGANPRVLAPPVAPVMTTPAVVDPVFDVTWTHDDPNGNDAVAYDVAQLYDPVNLDNAEFGNVIGWNNDGFTQSSQRSHQGNYSYFSGSDDNLNHSMTALFGHEVQPGDEVSFWTWYDIETDWDYAYLMVSTDGQTFVPIEGNITTNDNPNGTNQGNGITGNSGGWVQGVFPLDDYVGETVTIQVAYITDGGVSDPGFWFEELTPWQGYNSIDVLANAITETSYPQNWTGLPNDQMLYFTARAIDADDQVSDWATPDEVLVQAGGLPASLTLTGVNTSVPAGGGTVTYSVALTTSIPQPFPGVTWWTMAELPNGNVFGPVDQQTVAIPANADVTVPMSLNVPGFAPAGAYTFTGYLGYYPNSVLDDSFEFTKQAAGTDGAVGEQISAWGGSELDLASAGGNVATVPEQFELSRAYPNPFNPTTSITLSLPETTELTVQVVDIQGRQVAELASGSMSAGTHALVFDGAGLASGVYFIHADAAAFGNQVRKVVLMK